MRHDEWLAFITTLPWVLFLALIGGGVRFIQMLNQSTSPLPLSKHVLIGIGELIVSGFTGLVTFLMCQEFGASNNFTAFAVAISGHLGGNGIELLSREFRRRFK